MLASVFKGLGILVYLGIIMQLYGIIYAILEDKFRKALNSATILIIGMMVVGVGLGSKNVLIGTSILACSHIFYKQLLIMIAGLAEKNLFTDRFSKAAKIIMDSKLLIASSIIAYLGLISFPGSASFIGKSIIISELAYFNHTLYEILLLISSLIFFIIPISKFNGLETEANQQSNYLTHSKCESESLFLLLAINLIFSLGIYPLYNMNFFGDNVILKQLEWKQISAQFSLLSAGMLLYLIFRHQDLKTTHDLISTNYCYNVFNLPTNDIIEWKNKKIKNFTEKLKFVSYKIQSGAAHINNLDMAGQLIFVIIVINLMIILM
jgi:multicomponent Na+:H+ antiporter subunit D